MAHYARYGGRLKERAIILQRAKEVLLARDEL